MSEDAELWERIAVYLRGGWGRAPQREREGDCGWYAIVTTAQHERQAAAGLAERGFTYFLPLQTDWCGKPKVRHMSPLLPGYVFALCAETDFAGLHGIEGVAGFVRYQREDGSLWPYPFPPLAILGLQADERNGLFDNTRTVRAPKYQPKRGERVKIKAGDYYGFFARVLATPTANRRKLVIEGFDPPRHKTLDVAHLEAA